MSKKIPLLAVVGPTASGKTALAVELAKRYNGEVVSADSMQIYKGLSVVTAKPTEDEMQGVVHHLIDFLEPEQDFSVADFVRLASEKIGDIVGRGRLPVLCGGTGLYVSSLVDNVSFDSSVGSTEIRRELEAYAEANGRHELWLRLLEADPETAQKVHENNLPRVIRALEVFEATGKPLSWHKKQSRLVSSPYSACMIGLDCRDRAVLYDRINRRVDIMIENGLVDEAKTFYEGFMPATAYQAIGYKELIPYFEGRETLEEAVEHIKLETRHYAKRQLTWFRRREDINWLFIDEFDSKETLAEAACRIAGSFVSEI